MNRGIAKRPVFESRREIRFFLSLLARKVRAGEIEVEAYSFLSTHFHLLVRSPLGELSSVMMWIESQFVRWFNWHRDRDGPLFRGRFRSRIVDSHKYWTTLIRYIDDNAVEAGIVDQCTDYPYGSARHYALARGPVWLRREDVEKELTERERTQVYRPELYATCFGQRPSPAQRWLIHRRIESSARSQGRHGSLDDLIAAAPEKVREHLRARARLADGCDIGSPVAAPCAVLEQIDHLEREGALFASIGRSRRRSTLTAGLLKGACSLNHAEIASAMEVVESTASRWVREHRRLCDGDGAYMATAARLLELALRSTFCDSNGRAT